MHIHALTAATIAALLLAPTAAAQIWQERVEFDEAAFPSATTVLQTGAGSVTAEYDVLTFGGTTALGNAIYVAGPDGTNDLRITTTVALTPGNPWTQTEADYDTTSLGSFRSDWTISDFQSRSGDGGYVKFDVEFINGLETAVNAEYFATRATSTNGSSEGYEWSFVTVNGTPIDEAAILTYTADDYSDTSGATGSGLPFPNRVTMSEFLTSAAAGTIAPGGLVQPGWWAIDDFNTTVLDGPEAASTNPSAGNGSVDDNQTISGTTTSPLFDDGDLGLASTDLVSRVTWYFGLADVAFDTDGDGFTRTNTLPSAGFTYMELGFQEPDTATLCVDEQTPSGVTGLVAHVDLLGSTSISANDFTLQVSNMPPNQVAVLVLGTNFAATPGAGFADGAFCINPFVRFFKVINVGPTGAMDIPIDLTSTGPFFDFSMIMPGDLYYFQYAHRDGPGTARTSDVLAVRFTN